MFSYFALTELLVVLICNPMQVGIYLPCYDVFRNWMEDLTTQNIPAATPYVPLVAGSLARSLACATCYPIELARTRMQVEKMFLYMFNSLYLPS